MTEIRRTLLLVIQLCLLVLLASSCALGPVPPSAPEERAGVDIHTWRALREDPTQVWTGPRTALYTYVLVGDVGGASGEANEATGRAVRALARLLREVQASQPILPTAGGPQLSPAVLARANQFCVPLRAASSTPVTPENYDFDLARRYRDTFLLLVDEQPEMARSLHSLGPFLVATRKPLAEMMSLRPDGRAEVDTESPILLVDMSGRHEESMSVYVLAFREAVREQVAGRSVFRPLSPAFASRVLELNEALPLVAEAYAGTKRLFK